MKKIAIITLLLVSSIAMQAARPKKYPNGAFIGDRTNKNTEVKELVSPYEEAM